MWPLCASKNASIKLIIKKTLMRPLWSLKRNRHKKSNCSSLPQAKEATHEPHQGSFSVSFHCLRDKREWGSLSWSGLSPCLRLFSKPETREVSQCCSTESQPSIGSGTEGGWRCGGRLEAESCALGTHHSAVVSANRWKLCSPLQISFRFQISFQEFIFW